MTHTTIIPDPVPGQVFGHLTVLGFSHKDAKKTPHYTCLCECGRTCTPNKYNLVKGKSTRCFYHRGKAPKDLSGQQFGRLLAIKIVGQNIHGKSLWLCRCDCGKEAEVIASHLVSGNTSSCGCLQREVKPTRTHGLSGTAEYKVWQSMKRRCSNPKESGYHRYGGRGIRVCDRWVNSFVNFIQDMGNRPTNLHSIERIDNNGHYDPSNCKWALKSEQANNTRQNRFLEFQGIRLTLTQWADRVGLNRDCLRGRLDKGWSVEEALTTPTMRVKSVSTDPGEIEIIDKRIKTLEK